MHCGEYTAAWKLQIVVSLFALVFTLATQAQQLPLNVLPQGCDCKDLSPPGRLTCLQQKMGNKCDVDWMIVGGFCEYTCERCLCQMKGQKCDCTDLPPKHKTCPQIFREKMCLDEGVVSKNHCATTCNRCRCDQADVTVTQWASNIEQKVISGNISIEESQQLIHIIDKMTQNDDSTELSQLYSLVTSPLVEDSQQDQPNDAFWAYRSAKDDESFCQTDVMYTLKNSSDYTYMAQALVASGMDLVLQHTSTPHTLFVPNNDAFTALANLLETDIDTMLSLQAIRKIVGYHIVDKHAYNEKGLMEIAVASTLVPDFPLFIDVSRDLKLVETVAGGRAEIVEFDIPACQAIIHVIDGILSPNGPANQILAAELESQKMDNSLVKNDNLMEAVGELVVEKNKTVVPQFKSFPDEDEFPPSVLMVGDELPPMGENEECSDVTALQLLKSHPRLDHVPKAMMMYELAHTILTNKSRSLTVFVPEENAFLQTLQKIASVSPMDILTARNLILYHVIPDELITENDLSLKQKYVTMTNLSLTIQDSEIESVGSTVKVLESNLGNACNVEIHIIEDILLPFELPEELDQVQNFDLESSNYGYEIYESATSNVNKSTKCTDQSALQVLRMHPNLNSIEPSLVFAGVEDLFASDEVTMTVFIPHDDAFSAVVDRMVEDDDGDYGGIFDPFNRHYLKSILLYHIIPDTVANSTILKSGSSWETLLTDAELQIQTGPNGGLQVVGVGKRANILSTDVGALAACNMIVHVIDDILLPINPTLTGDAGMDYGLMLRQSLEENDLAFQTDILKRGCDPSITPMSVMLKDPLLNTMSMSIIDSQQELVLNRVDKEATIFLPDAEGGWQLLNTILKSGMPDDLLSPNNRMFWGSIFLYHVIPDVRLTAENLSNSTGLQFSSMFNSVPITINSNGNGGLVIQGAGNSARITSMDVSVACKVAVHVIDAVLLPFTVDGLSDVSSSPVPVQSTAPYYLPMPTTPTIQLPVDTQSTLSQADDIQPEAATILPQIQYYQESISLKTDESSDDLSVILEQAAARDSPPEISCKTIGEVMENDPSISILSLLMREAGLVNILDVPNAGLTIIAPLNEAMVQSFDFFDVLQMSLNTDTDNAREFYNTMRYHIIQGQVRLEHLPPMGSNLTTLAVDPLTSKPTEVRVAPAIDPNTDLPVITFQGEYNEVRVIGDPIESACGSLIYPVDQMLLVEKQQESKEQDSAVGGSSDEVQTVPAVLTQKAADTDCIPIMNIIQGHPKLSSFADLLKRAGMSGALTRGKNITVFAPDDKGLSIILEALGNNVDLLELEGLQAWMGYHVVSGIFMQQDMELGMQLSTYTLSHTQEPLMFSIADTITAAGGRSNTTIIDSIGSQSSITENDLLSCGGVVHVLDVPLMPVASTTQNK